MAKVLYSTGKRSQGTNCDRETDHLLSKVVWKSQAKSLHKSRPQGTLTFRPSDAKRERGLVGWHGTSMRKGGLDDVAKTRKLEHCGPRSSDDIVVGGRFWVQQKFALEAQEELRGSIKWRSVNDRPRGRSSQLLELRTGEARKFDTEQHTG